MIDKTWKVSAVRRRLVRVRGVSMLLVGVVLFSMACGSEVPAQAPLPSPEPTLGHAVDHRADLYSAGVVLFEMLAGRKPFCADTLSALVYQHVYAEIPSLPEHASAFQPLINSLLAKDPDERMPIAYALVAAIDRLQRRCAA